MASMNEATYGVADRKGERLQFTVCSKSRGFMFLLAETATGLTVTYAPARGDMRHM